MQLKHICIVEDEVDLLNMYANFFSAENFKVSVFRTAETFWSSYHELNPDLIILDRTLSGENGLDLVKKIRKEDLHTPILLVSGHSSVDEKVEALKLGADDYVTKPFSLIELHARIERHLSRQAKPVVESISNKDSLEFDSGNRCLIYKNNKIYFTDREFFVLQELNKKINSFVKREKLESVASKARSLDVHILSLRKKMSPLGYEIKTLRGVGYCLRKAISKVS